MHRRADPDARATRPSRHRSRLAAVLAGLLSGGLTLGVGTLLASFVTRSADPVLGVGQEFITRTPEWLKEWAIRQFGEADKAVLLGSLYVTLVLLFVVIGLVALRRLRVGLALVLLLGLAAVGATVNRPDATALSWLPSTVGTLAGAGALLLLVRALHARTPAATGPLSRRSVLFGAVAGAAALTAGAGTAVNRSNSVAATRAGIVLPRPSSAAPALPAGLDSVDAITPYVTSAKDFYRVDTALSVPQVDVAGWTLRIHGMVDREITVTFDDLLGEDLVERWMTMTCVSNEVGGNLVGNARWLGMPLARLLERAGVRPEADMLFSRSVDGFTISTPVAAVTDGRDAMIAIGMNGEPLTDVHGFPARMIVPGLYGYVSACKWITEIEVTRFDAQTAYWTDRGWAEQAPIKTATRIDVPMSFAMIPAGQTVPIAGVAWAQTRGISRVEVRIDDGDWADATLVPTVSTSTWVQWTYAWDGATAGSHTIRARATDATGQVQTEDVVKPIPDGSSGWPSKFFTIT
ncbi:molybdopterin-dependent oxidoreductase [Kineococcus rubinsiae]|uniref:molybdopterin-dependent oxidoreductase n=1 Tax=Kineococcus rubinsiae TaxID=2609562 RepID=UPI001AD8A874|nr:molybdopterin-dependent oxidoreductase [Kineococcus rubinsiae]